MADLVPMSQAATTSLVTTLQNTDLFALAREDITSETGYRSKVARVDAMAKKVVNETDYSQLQTTDKKIIGAINEVNAKASQFDNMTATASGSIASFTDGGDDIPVSEYECEIVAQQASGTPTPTSPLPISGFSQADISVSGINLFDNSLMVNSQTTVVGDTVTLTATGNFQGSAFAFMPVKQGCKYALNIDSLTSGSGVEIRRYDSTGTVTNTISITQSTIININDGTTVKISIVYSNKTAGAGTFVLKGFNIALGEEYQSYHAYTGNLYTVAFGQTIYGGRLIYKNGEWAIEATFGYVALTGSEPTIDRYSMEDDIVVFRITTGLTAINTNTQISNKLVYNGNAYAADSRYLYNFVLGNTGNLFINVKNTDAGDVATFRTWLANEGIEIVYPLAIPVIIPITSSTRVKTISGVNNIFSNTGDNSVKYFTENADSLAELIKAFVL